MGHLQWMDDARTTKKMFQANLQQKQPFFVGGEFMS
jgi:hypothetical protein